MLVQLFLILHGMSLAYAGDKDNPYRHTDNLNSDGRYVLTWEVEGSRISFSVTARTIGYVGLGLSPKGNMTGADIVIGGVTSNGNSYFKDYHVVEDNKLIEDLTQDWALHSASENGTHTFLNFSRLLDTCDCNDYPINNDVLAVIWALGENDDVSVHHFQNRGEKYFYLLDADLTPRILSEARRNGRVPNSIELGNVQLWSTHRQISVPPRDTTYWCSMHKAPVLQKKHHLIGFEIRFESDEAFTHTHHHLAFRCTPPVGVDPVSIFDPFVRNGTEEQCYFLARHDGILPTQYCTEVKFAYAIGERLFFMPDHTGIPFGESPHEYFVFQAHFDNPNRQNLNYAYDVDMYYTSELRQHDAGIMTIGHHIPGSPSILVPPNTPAHNIFGHCGDACTNKMLPEDGINIIGVQLHTHYAGRRFRFRHFRENQELPWISNDDNYNNLFQPMRLLKKERNIRPGDHLTTRCVYDSTQSNGSIVGGFGTSEEMCLSYIWYYNELQDYSLCRSEIGSERFLYQYLGIRNYTWSQPDLEFVATSPLPLAGKTISQVSDDVNWTAQLRLELQQDHQYLSQVNTCSKSPFSSSGQGQVGNDTTEIVNYPSGIREYSERPTCFNRWDKVGRSWKGNRYSKRLVKHK